MNIVQKEIDGVLDELEEELRIFLEEIYQDKTTSCFLNLKDVLASDNPKHYKKDPNLYKKVKKSRSFSKVPFPECLQILKGSWTNISLIKRRLTERDRRFSANYILETITIRNNYYGHKIRGEIPIKETYRIFDTLLRFGIAINAQKFVLDGIEKLLDEYLTQINLDIDERNNLDTQNFTEEGTKVYKSKTNEYSLEIKPINISKNIRDVLSVPAGITYEIILETQIHSCPNDKEKYKYDPTQFITFRNIKGEMDSLYKIDFILVLRGLGRVLTINRQGASNVFELIDKVLRRENHLLSDAQLNRLQKYCQDNTFPNNNRFYILSEEKIKFPKITYNDKKHSSIRGKGGGETPPIYYWISDLIKS